MRRVAFYLIEPRSELEDWLKDRVDPGLAEILLGQTLLSHTEADRSCWAESDHAEAVKLAYLASLREYASLETDAGFETVLGAPHISIQLFDRWWTIRRLLLDGSTEELWPFLAQHMESVERTGNGLVDTWLEWVQTNVTSG
jgi:hypothetical protein